MPPWKPVPGYGEFAGARSLPADEIATLSRWASGGAPEGNPADLPPPPPHQSARLAHPDLVVRMAKAFTVPAEGPDLYRCFVLPLNLTATDMSTRSSSGRAIREWCIMRILFVDRSQAGPKLEAEPGAGYPCFGAPGFLPAARAGRLVAWIAADSYAGRCFSDVESDAPIW